MKGLNGVVHLWSMCDSLKMLTKLTIQNFKRFKSKVEIELGNPVVFVGPNNSGKTSAMQAIYLWNVGLKCWTAKRSTGSKAKKGRGVAVNRKDLFAIASPASNLLWNDLHTRDVSRKSGKQETKNVRIEITVEGIAADDKSWKCGMEFDFANPESFYCRPLRTDDEGKGRLPVPDEAKEVNIAFLPPMSGLVAVETKIDSGAVNVRIGEGRTAEVLRNLCLQLAEEKPDEWKSVTEEMEALFQVKIKEPQHIRERGEITMAYSENNTDLDLSSSGRGLQQTLLILAYMKAHPNAIIMLDEPDAHLEIIRQRQNYDIITKIAESNGSQIIAASHSEVLLEEGADSAIAFIGTPHRITRKEQVRKALATIRSEDYYQAAIMGWVLYLEGPTDRAILRAFASRLQHNEAMDVLSRAFVRYVANQPNPAKDHYHGLQEALPNLQAVALFDRLESEPRSDSFPCLMWKKREIENYLCTKRTLIAYASGQVAKGEDAPLFSPQEEEQRKQAMEKAISKTSDALEALDEFRAWSDDIKASNQFLKPVFKSYFKALNMSRIMTKSKYHLLVDYIPDDEIDDEIKEKLDAIVNVATSASEQGLPS